MTAPVPLQPRLDPHHLTPVDRQVLALEDHLVRETRSSQALAARVANLEALCKVLGVVPELPPDGEPKFLPIAEVRAAYEAKRAQDLAEFNVGAAALVTTPITKTDPDGTVVHGTAYHRASHEVRMCAAAMVLRRVDNGEAEVLLVRRAPSAPYGVGAWTLPAGGTKPSDASLVATAARELCEETGLVLASSRVVRLVDGLTPTTGGFPFACAVVLGNARNPDAVINREPETHDAIAWFTRDTLPANTWDRAMLVDILDREEEAHWTTDAAGNPSITQTVEVSK